MRMGFLFPFHQKKIEYMKTLTFLCNEDLGIDDVSQRVCPHGGYSNIAYMSSICLQTFSSAFPSLISPKYFGENQSSTRIKKKKSTQKEQAEHNTQGDVTKVKYWPHWNKTQDSENLRDGKGYRPEALKLSCFGQIYLN